jgi:pimeloyl-ACP methyl ester carboxylesterase
MMDSKTFVLVHGAWHGGWCYSRVRKILQRQGHDVFTPSLSGLAEHSHNFSPAINASTHIQDIVNLIKFEGLDNVILAGHSYGGLVITGVADRIPERISALVYIDAFVGKDGCSCFDLDIPEFVQNHFDAAQSSGGHTSMPFAASLFGVNPADRAWVDANCTPHPFAALAERITLRGDFQKITNKTYIRAAGWHPSPFAPIYDEIRQQPGWKLHELHCGHDIMIDMPEETAAILTAAEDAT